MNRQLQARAQGEKRARLVLVQLLCGVSIWRTALTRLIPLCGAAAWWTALACLLPGFGSALLLRLAMSLTRSATLTEAARACLGRIGAALVSWTLAALLLVEGLSAMTALVTLFTEGVGARGTQFTMALLTGAILLFSLHREGLPRAAYLLRWGLACAALILAVFHAGEAQPDHLFPVFGGGRNTVYGAIQTSISLAWPVVLLLTVPSAGQRGRLSAGVLPAVLAVGAILLTTLTIPHELLLQATGLAETLLLPVRFALNALRVLNIALLTVTLFLSIGGCVRLAAEQICQPLKVGFAWLPYVLVGALCLSQATDVSALWRLLAKVEPWLIAPLLLIGSVCFIVAVFRRKRT